MRILITGACGFVGSTLARTWIESGSGHVLHAMDNLIRPGSEINRAALQRAGVRFQHGDLRCPSDFDTLPDVDVVVDAAANPSVLAGVDGRTSPRQLLEHNLLGTVNLLEFCRQRRAAFILLSTSRVYSIEPLAHLALELVDEAFRPAPSDDRPRGLSPAGVSEDFPTTPPLSLYGATKRASETLALEYGASFDLPVWINRCGVLAGAGQFGRPDQGLFAFWINAWRHRRPLRYIGFGGRGHQVRDCLHPADLVPLLEAQMTAAPGSAPRVVNVSGGASSARSLRQLSRWCEQRFGPHDVASETTDRAFDIPWMVLDAARAAETWGWQPRRTTEQILEEIALHAEAHPDWLEVSSSS